MNIKINFGKKEATRVFVGEKDTVITMPDGKVRVYIQAPNRVLDVTDESACNEHGNEVWDGATVAEAVARGLSWWVTTEGRLVFQAR